jgi:hypothetical protein
MNGPTTTNWRARLLVTGVAAVFATLALIAGPSPAKAFWIGFGGPCCGAYWGPGPYWGGYPPPYYYAPPPAYYPAAPGYYPPPAAAPSAYTPGTATPAYPPVGGGAPAAPAATPRITYTAKPAFTNSAGQACREYKTTDGGRDIFGTACKAADGQWRVVN